MTTNFEGNELAEAEKAHDEAYGAAKDAWFDAKVLENYRRRQNERLVNAFAARLIKSYVPQQGEEADFDDLVSTKSTDDLQGDNHD